MLAVLYLGTYISVEEQSNLLDPGTKFGISKYRSTYFEVPVLVQYMYQCASKCEYHKIYPAGTCTGTSTTKFDNIFMFGGTLSTLKYRYMYLKVHQVKTSNKNKK